MNKLRKNLSLSPIQKFIKAESFSGLLLFVSALIALILSNLPTRELFSAIWDYEIGITSKDFKLVKPLILWINDGLMAIFFFLIGLEIKRNHSWRIKFNKKSCSTNICSFRRNADTIIIFFSFK